MIQELRRLLDTPQTQETITEIKLLLSTHLAKNFKENKESFNLLCLQGKYELILYCKKVVPDFCLFDINDGPNGFSNISFFWAVRSGNVQLIDLFLNDSNIDFYKNRIKFESDLSGALNSYIVSKNFDKNNYGYILEKLSNKFPTVVTSLFDRASRENRNDEITEILKDFFIKKKEKISTFLLKNSRDSLTLHCVINLQNNSFNFAKFIRDQHKEYKLRHDIMEMNMFYFNPRKEQIQWIIENPNFFEFKKNRQHIIVENLFNKMHYTTMIRRKERHELFNFFVELGLISVSKKVFEVLIQKNILPLVKKYFKQVKNEDFSNLYIEDNESSNYIREKQIKLTYQKLNKDLSTKETDNKRNKI